MIDSLRSHSVETSSQSPRLLILSDDAADTSFLDARLTSLSYNVSASPYIGLDVDALGGLAPDFILCAIVKATPEVETAISQIKAKFAPKEIAVIGLLRSQKTNASKMFDTVLFQPAHPVQIHNRMSALTRLRRMEKALMLRRETLVSDFSVSCRSTERLFGVPFRILFVGSATPEFMAILNALQEKNVEVFAAFTSFSAFDYLHDNNFDAVVLNATESLEPAISISETMRRNPRLFHIPTLLMANETHTEVGEIAMKKGARDVFYAGASRYEICGRILELANFFRIHSQLKKELAEVDAVASLDPETSLYNRDFLHAHLKRVSENYAQVGETITLLLFRVRPNAREAVPAELINEAIVKIGAMLSSLVRSEDITARVSTDVFAVAFPGQSPSVIEVVGRRIKDIINCAAFESGDSGVLTLEVELMLSEKMAHENSDHFINRSEQELLGDPFSPKPALAAN